MIYTSIRQLINDVIEFQEDTPSSIYGMTSEREARLAHYFDLAAEEVFNARSWWPFRHATTILTLASGQAPLPRNFGGIGITGYVVRGAAGRGNLPWLEVDYQELIAMRNNNVWPARYQQNRVYAMGPPVNVDNAVSDAVASANVSDTYNLQSSAGELPLFTLGTVVVIGGFADAANNGTFTLDVITSAGSNWDITKVDGSAVGIAQGPSAITVGSTPGDRLSILSGNPGDDAVITVYHDVQLARTDPDTDLDDAVPLPSYLHDAVYKGTSWYANRSKNDRRDNDYHDDFMKALSTGIKVGRLKANRPQQLPMSVGRMW